MLRFTGRTLLHLRRLLYEVELFEKTGYHRWPPHTMLYNLAFFTDNERCAATLFE